MEFIHSVLAQNESVAVGTVVSYDLPVNPLSHIMITVKAQQNLANVATLLLGFEQWGVNAHGNDDDYRTIMYLVPLGRKLYWPREAFPRSTRGELILQITYGDPFGGWSDHKVQIETVEMPDAAPERFLRMTTLSVSATAAGELDVEIPIGNPISDLILFGTTIPLHGGAVLSAPGLLGRSRSSADFSNAGTVARYIREHSEEPCLRAAVADTVRYQHGR